MPIQGFSGFGGGATSAAFRSAADEAKYVDEVYSTYVWTGTGSSNSITNNVNLSGKGGMVWVKNRDQNDNNWLFSSAMGIGNGMRSNSNGDKFGLGNAGMSSFNSDGFTVGTHGGVNGTSEDIVSWTFRNSKAFQTLTYEGTGSTAQNISHSLGSVPGMIIIKNIDETGTNWIVKHRSLPGANEYIMLNSTNKDAQDSNIWNNTNPTATQFTVGNSDETNTDGDTHVAYIFAGGESTAATAVSVDFDDDDGLDVGASSDFNFGTGQFCIECWVYLNEAPGTGSPSYARVFQQDGPTGNSSYSNLQVTINPGDGTLHAWAYGGGNPVGIVGSIDLEGGWHHIAVNRDSNNVITQWVDGVPDGTVTTATNFNPNSGSPRPRIGSYDNGGTNGVFNGKISNLRVTVGEPVYTAAFTPSKEPLTTTSQGVTASNVKLLCCNDSSTTGSTTTSGTITANGDPTADTQSPFDDPAGFAFGEDEDTNIVKMGRYRGNGSDIGRDVYLGWQPQFVLIKRIDSAEIWMIFDEIRGIVTGGNDKQLRPGSSALEYQYDRLELISTGFRPMTDNQYTNASAGEYMYMAFRNTDGYVAKPVETATDVFTVVNSDGSALPWFRGNHTVDFQTFKERAGTDNWWTSFRLSQGKYMQTNSTAAEGSNSNQQFDYMDGYNAYDADVDTYTAYMWKRHAGFDIMTYNGNGVSGRQMPHSLNAVPEMIWVKRRNATENWYVYHKGVNGGTNPADYMLYLNTDDGQIDHDAAWYNTIPTSTYFTLGNDTAVNSGGTTRYAAMLFASVSGISKVGSYTGSGSSATQTITTGFQPRFVIIKDYTAGSNPWYVMDTVRGWASGNDLILQLNDNAAQLTGNDWGAPTSTGFTVTGNGINLNSSSNKYIYYAHA